MFREKLLGFFPKNFVISLRRHHRAAGFGRSEKGRPTNSYIITLFQVEVVVVNIEKNTIFSEPPCRDTIHA